MVVVDFDPADERADDVLHADTVEVINAFGDFSGEVFETADDEQEIALAFDRVEPGLVSLLEDGQTLLQTRDTRLKLCLLNDALGIAVYEPADAASHGCNLLLQADDIGGHVGSVAGLADPATIFIGDTFRFPQERLHLIPDELFQLVAAHRSVAANRLPVEPRSIGARAAVIAQNVSRIVGT